MKDNELKLDMAIRGPGHKDNADIKNEILALETQLLSFIKRDILRDILKK
ncbi:MAG: hypothetical protein HY802_00885 [Methanobacterium sp.]|nr:hypothetical protein [Methanobacterium sp.]